MKVDDLLSQPVAWLATDASQDGIVVSSRVRLARNLAETSFPSWASEDESAQVWKRLEPLLLGLPELAPAHAFAMDALPMIDRQVLFERHLISLEQMERGRGSGLVFTEDETLAIMVNEEDHLRLQALRAGLALQDLWRRIDALDTAIEQLVPYAFSPKLGYLTSCPTNVGTGLRASVMLHLPGLVLWNEMGPIVKGMGKIGLAVRGLWGEGTESAGHMFQVSNQVTLGETEEQILNGLEQIVQELVGHEMNARLRLLEKRKDLLRDHVGRALGILTHAHILNSKEALDLLSALRLGIGTGILKSVKRETVDRLLLDTLPAHMQKAAGKELKPKERDRIRARLVRDRLTARPGHRRANGAEKT